MVRSAGSVQFSATVPGPVIFADMLCGGPEGQSDPPVHGAYPHAGVGLVHVPMKGSKAVHVHVSSHVAAPASGTCTEKRRMTASTIDSKEHARQKVFSLPTQLSLFSPIVPFAVVLLYF